VLFAVSSTANARVNTVAIRSGLLLDSKSGKTLEHQVILIEGEKIKSVGSAASTTIPQGAQEIDLSKATVLSGLIDGHTHVFGFGLDGIKLGGPPFASAGSNAWAL
jgi:imidazolonepropionase-like amidohydrolase